jgi:1-acyl-sn-glycerol-3-phosphate acyltransferase
MCIFPEGRTTPNGIIQQAKGGVVYLAYITNVPVVPVRLNGTFRFSIKDFFMKKINLSVSFGKPIYFSAQNESFIPIGECKDMANDVMNIIKNMV